ncbi:MAG: putative Rht family transporter, amino acid efflux [Verrucomicrobiales bacterium]|nr:putative Rht family transporter, amino acid efflux [Verrucomicrobiales bacterium]
MFGTQHLIAFIVAGLVLNITPGPDTFYILGRTLSQGRRAGVASVLGIATGSLIHTCAAAFGLSTLLATSAMAFVVVKTLGACYLLFLGLRALFGKSSAKFSKSNLKPEMIATIYLQGVVTNVLNPKVALFFLAFLPQFVSADAPNKAASFIFLGSVFVFNGTLYCTTLVFLAARIIKRFQGNASFENWMKMLTGIIFVALGLRVAGSKSN